MGSDLSADITTTVSCVPGTRQLPQAWRRDGLRRLGAGAWEGALGGGFLGMDCLLPLHWTSPPPAPAPRGHSLGQKHMQGHTASSPGNMDYRGVKVK